MGVSASTASPSAPGSEPSPLIPQTYENLCRVICATLTRTEIQSYGQGSIRFDSTGGRSRRKPRLSSSSRGVNVTARGTRRTTSSQETDLDESLTLDESDSPLKDPSSTKGHLLASGAQEERKIYNAVNVDDRDGCDNRGNDPGYYHDAAVNGNHGSPEDDTTVLGADSDRRRRAASAEEAVGADPREALSPLVECVTEGSSELPFVVASGGMRTRCRFVRGDERPSSPSSEEADDNRSSRAASGSRPEHRELSAHPKVPRIPLSQNPEVTMKALAAHDQTTPLSRIGYKNPPLSEISPAAVRKAPRQGFATADGSRGEGDELLGHQSALRHRGSYHPRRSNQNPPAAGAATASTSPPPRSAYIDCNKTRVAVYGNPANHVPFLEPEILPHFFPFIMDASLSVCLSVCPHWFLTLYEYLKKSCAPIIENFVSIYHQTADCGNSGGAPPGLKLEGSTVSIQPLFTAHPAAVRIDLLLYCRVLRSCQNNCSQFGYCFKYAPSDGHRAVGSRLYYNEMSKAAVQSDPPRGICDSFQSATDWTHFDPLKSTRLLEPSPPEECGSGRRTGRGGDQPADTTGVILAPPSSTFGTAGDVQIFQCVFRFECLRQGSRRSLWILRDLCRFHGDELMVATLSSVPTVNVDDILEVPVNLCNAFGAIRVESVRWLPVVPVPKHLRQFGQHCELERGNQTWVNLSSFQPTTSERLQINDCFGPQWRHIKTDFTGIDVAYSRSLYVAEATGEVPKSRRWLGIESIVKRETEPIICPLTRLGLQHDRFSRQQVRRGDSLTLYISQGGGVLL